jgi:hypothetical protein
MNYEDVEVYIPGAEPTDLVGYTNYILTCFAVDAPMQIPDCLMLDIPGAGIHTEIHSTR